MKTTVEEALRQFEIRQREKHPSLTDKEMYDLRLGFVYGVEWALRNEVEKLEQEVRGL